MIANYHTHTWRCNHAQGDAGDYAAAAREAGVRVLGFSDHAPYCFPRGYRSGFRMELCQLEDYVRKVLETRHEYKGEMEVLLGLELEYYPKFLSELLPILRDQPMEYLLLGQHFVDNEIGAHYSGNITPDESILKQYCRQVCDAMQTGLFTCLAHPDLLHFTGSRAVYEAHMGQVVREAKACGIPLEMNLLGLAQGRHYPNPTFWALAAEEGCAVILGRDAHSPREMGDAATEDRALSMLREYGITPAEKAALRPIR